MSSPAHKALRPIALFEALKGAGALIVGFGLLSFLGRDAQQLAEQLLVRMHLDPANHYLRIFVLWMSAVTDTRLWLMAGLATLYATIRFIEAFGLWYGRRWAEWFAAFSGGIYLPIEIFQLARRQTFIHFATLVVNVAIVAYMVWLLSESKRRAAGARLSPPPAG